MRHRVWSWINIGTWWHSQKCIQALLSSVGPSNSKSMHNIGWFGVPLAVWNAICSFVVFCMCLVTGLLPLHRSFCIAVFLCNLTSLLSFGWNMYGDIPFGPVRPCGFCLKVATALWQLNCRVFFCELQGDLVFYFILLCLLASLNKARKGLRFSVELAAC